MAWPDIPINSRALDETMNTQYLAPSPFFYYNPEQSADSRQHGLFSSHPSTVVCSTQLQNFHQPAYAPQGYMNPQQPHIAGHPAQSNPQMYMPFPMQAVTTPVASPRPIYHKPSVLFHDGRSLSLETECENYMYPATPPLSVSGSAVSSPPMSSGVLPTPTGPVFFAENIEGVKEGCEGEVKSEILAGGDWARCGSPPLTPGT